VVERLVQLIAAQQHTDGHWENADLFLALDALMAAGMPAGRAAVRRAVPALEERQRPDGSFGATAQQERALVGLRALHWAGATSPAPGRAARAAASVSSRPEQV
jgi:hypothetical protein